MWIVEVYEMGRKRREDGPGVWHHVFVRGVAGRTIFVDDVDRAVFYRHLGAQVFAGRLVVFAFVLMTNHFHLLVMSPTGELAVAMRELLRPFVLTFNPRQGRDGPLFRSRFGSKPVKSHSYRVAVLRYIDRNPVGAGMVARGIDYCHGSAFHFHHGTSPRWLDESWAERVLREGRGIAGLPKGAYGAGEARPYDRESDQLVEARMRAAGTVDPLDRDFSSAEARSAFLTSYLEQTCRGSRDTRELPTASGLSVMRLSDKLAAEDGDWCARVGRGSAGWLELVKPGLMRRMTGRTEHEIAGDLGCSLRTATRRADLHEELFREDVEYRAMALRVAERVLWR